MLYKWSWLLLVFSVAILISGTLIVELLVDYLGFKIGEGSDASFGTSIFLLVIICIISGLLSILSVIFGLMVIKKRKSVLFWVTPQIIIYIIVFYQLINL